MNEINTTTTIMILPKGTRSFKLNYQVLFADGSRSGLNVVTIKETFNEYDAIESFRTYLEFLFSDYTITPVTEFFDCEEVFEEILIPLI